ncbi:hypothetical protein V502_08223 [Pseudogymnoascus sp. VKM F-4520 (FW-2644)]|nr:hypothetical protein V502_08223 [Pseudogymnoascus sp. VKM F-4520 (FW-2644)]
MASPHETFFFLTGGTGPRPTSAAFFAAAAQRTAKTKEERRKCEERKEKMRARQMQREIASNEVGDVGVGVMRLLGLRRVGEKRARKGRDIEGEQVDKNGKASSGGGDTEKDADGTSKEELAKDAASSEKPEKEATENDIVQSAGYDAGILSHGETHAVAHQGALHITCNNASDNGHISIGQSPHTQDGEVGMLLDADEVIASTPGLLDGEKAATVSDRESVAPNVTHNSPFQKVQSIHESVHSHIPNTPPMWPVSLGLKVDSDINPDDIRPPILVPAPDPDDNLDCDHDHESTPSDALLKNMQPGSESDINPDDIRPPILVPAPDPDDSSEPIPQNNTQPGLENNLNPDDIRPPILVPAPDLDDSAEEGGSKGMPPGLESNTSPPDIRPPIITLSQDPDDNSNDSHDRPPELSPNLSATLEPQDAELDVQIRHDVRDPFSPTPHLPPPWEATNIPYPHDENDPFSPTPPRPWERPDEMFQSIRSSPPPELDRITPSERRFKISHDAKDLLLIASRSPPPRESIHRQPSAERGTPNLQNAEDPFSPTPHLPPPWEAPFHYTEFSQAISPSPLPHPSLPTPSPVSVEVGQKITPSPHLDLPTPSSFFLHKASSRPMSRASSFRNSIIEHSPASLPMYEYNGPDAHLVPLPASREPSIAELTRSLSTYTPLDGAGGHSIDNGERRLLSGMEDVSHRVLTSKSGYGGNDMGKHVGRPTEQTISQPLPSRERAQQTVKWVRGGGGWSGDWVRVME